MPAPKAPLLALSATLAALSTFGCGTASGPSVTSPVPPVSHLISGSVHGGQQPVVGAQIALYAAGKSGLASPARSMLTVPVLSSAGGSFSITGDYTLSAR